MDMTQNMDVQYITKKDNKHNSQMIFKFQYQPATREVFRDVKIILIYL